MNLTGQTPIADRIAARMAADDGDRHFAPGAAYRAHGMDPQEWVDVMNRYMHGYEIRPWLPKTRGPDSYALWYKPESGPATRFPDDITPRTMSAPDVFAIVRRHQRTLERPPLPPIPLLIERLARLRAEEPEETSGMRP